MLVLSCLAWGYRTNRALPPFLGDLFFQLNYRIIKLERLWCSFAPCTPFGGAFFAAAEEGGDGTGAGIAVRGGPGGAAADAAPGHAARSGAADGQCCCVKYFFVFGC